MKTKYNILFVAFLSLAFAACSNKNADLPSEESAGKAASVDAKVSFNQDQYRLSGIQLGKVEQRNIEDVIRLNGSVLVKPGAKVSISAVYGGYIKFKDLLEGKKVRKGEQIAYVENPKFIKLQQNYLEALAQEQYLKLEFERQTQLREADVTSAKTYQKVKADYQALQAKLKALLQEMKIAGINIEKVKNGEILAQASLRSPITGYLKSIKVNNGMYVNADDELFQVINSDEIYLSLNSFEKDFGKIQAGQKIRFALSGELKYNRNAEVKLLAKSADQNRIVTVSADVLDEDKSDLIPGTYVKAWLAAESKLSKVVATDALVQYEGRDYLVVLQSKTNGNYHFDFVLVKKGISQEEYTEVDLPSNFKMDTPIVSEGAYAILSAMKNLEEEE